MNCSCFSCSQYREWDKIDFLRKTTVRQNANLMSVSSDMVDSPMPFNRLSDEVLMHIFDYIPPTNIRNFITVIAAEMVSKQFRRCMIDNKNIWETVSELVIGFDPDLTEDQYLCHIGHFTLELFLRRVLKITKVIVNVDPWLCHDILNNQILPIIDRFVEKLQIQQLIVHDLSKKNVSLNEKLINYSTQSLETFKFLPVPFHPKPDFETLFKIKSVLANCEVLKNFIVAAYTTRDFDSTFLSFPNSIETLEISGYTLESIIRAARILFSPPSIGYIDGIQHISPTFQIQTLRFTDPFVGYGHDGNQRLNELKNLLSRQNASSIRELVFDYCAYHDFLSSLPLILVGVNYLTTFILIFSTLKFNRTHKIVEFLRNVIGTKDMKVSIIFKHFDDDFDEKLEIVQSLLIAFDVAHSLEHEHIWEFIRGRVTVTLKLEKVENESLTCHH